MSLPLIKVVQLTLTNRCQCNCIHCGVSKLRKEIKGELTGAQIDSIFQDLKLAGCIVVDLFGGEPTLRDDLFDIIARGKSYGFIMSLETNGYVIDREYMARLVASGLDQIYLSLDDYRPEVHDAIRRKKGSFDRAVRALELGAETGMVMHVSTVPPSRDVFINGDFHRFMQFVLDHGAQKVRLLLPRFVGDSIRADSGPACAGEERELFSHVSPRYHDYIYVHTPGTPPGEKNICTAKHVFCHVMSNGWVAPCPYFPLVFGDILREPVIDIFERIQSHPLVRLGGDYCPMRNEEYINTHMRELGLERPFFPITVENQVDLGSPCLSGCPDCSYGSRTIPRPGDEVVQAAREVPSAYTRLEFYGGDAFLREDLFDILDRVPPARKIILWSTCNRVPADPSFGQRLQSYPIEAVKLHLSLPLGRDTAGAPAEAGLEEALQRVNFMCSWGLPVYVYVPMELLARFRAVFETNIRRLGIQRLYSFTRDPERPPINSVACFGRGFDRARILWAERRNEPADHLPS